MLACKSHKNTAVWLWAVAKLGLVPFFYLVDNMINHANLYGFCLVSLTLYGDWHGWNYDS